MAEFRPAGNSAMKGRSMKQFKCPRRAETGFGDILFYKRENDYDEARDNCFYCGSLDPDTFMARIEGGTILLGATDKNYKVYVTNDGGDSLATVKFYFPHLSEEQKKRFVELMNEKKLKFEGGIGFYVLPFFCRRSPAHG